MDLYFRGRSETFHSLTSSDNKLIHELLDQALSSEDIQINYFKSASDFLFWKNRNHIDALLIDMNLGPECESGIEVSKRINSKTFLVTNDFDSKKVLEMAKLENLPVFPKTLIKRAK